MTNIANPAAESNSKAAKNNITASAESTFPESTSERDGENDFKKHGFSKTLAQVRNKKGEPLGWNAAIILRYLSHMVRKYGESRDRKRWGRINLDRITKQYPYMGRSTVDENVLRLRDFGCCEIENLNQEFGRPKYDRTRWYHVPKKWMDATENAPRYFDKAIAAQVGVPAAAIYHNFCYWIEECKENKVEERVRLRPEILVYLLPFSKPTIKRAVKRLIKKGLIIPVEDKECWYIHSVAGSKADKGGSKADKGGSKADKGGSKADNDSINSILINPLEENSKEEAALPSSELSSDGTNNICSSDYSSYAGIMFDADEQEGREMLHEEDIPAANFIISSDDDIPGSASDVIIKWPRVENYEQLHLINRNNKYIAQAIDKNPCSKKLFLETADDICRNILKYLDADATDKLYYGCSEDEIVATLLPFLQDYFSRTNIDRDGWLFELFYYGSLECVVGAFLWPEDNSDWYVHGISLLAAVTYHMHCCVEKYFDEINQKLVEEEFAERRKEFASVDEHKEHDADAAPAEKTRTFRNGLNSRNKVGWIFYDQQHRTDCINITPLGLKLIETLFVRNPELSAADLLTIMDRCMRLYVNQPPPSNTIHYNIQWHARHGAQDVQTFAMYLKAIVRDVDYTRPIVFLGDGQEAVGTMAA